MLIARCTTMVVTAVLFVFASAGHSPAGPIHDAAKAGDAAEVEASISAGTDVNNKDVASRTALHWAADIGHLDLVEMLIAKNAAIDAKDVTGDTPLHLAVLSHHEDVVKFLIARGADVNALDAYRSSQECGCRMRDEPAVF